jgi:DNA polymerase
VFGEGLKSAEIVFVGEQPGDKEDLAGKPFVGPAGRVFDEGLAAAGIDRRLAYVTNAVKHFKWEARGKRRIHQKPTRPSSPRAGPGWMPTRGGRRRSSSPSGATAAQVASGRSSG